MLQCFLSINPSVTSALCLRCLTASSLISTLCVNRSALFWPGASWGPKAPCMTSAASSRSVSPPESTSGTNGYLPVPSKSDLYLPSVSMFTTRHHCANVHKAKLGIFCKNILYTNKLKKMLINRKHTKTIATSLQIWCLAAILGLRSVYFFYFDSLPNNGWLWFIVNIIKYNKVQR